nr:elongation factor G [Desulfuromonadales bacterium]NIR33102.1 elongation factor G [Desulfuromonadales bacterium]NIS39342.1 elongation factor G [Desulfuromonadales bacterium]
ELPCDPEGPLCALAFKVLSDQGRKLTYLRLYSGRLHAGDTLWNSTREIGDRVARLFRMHSHKRERIDEARAGDIVAATGLKEVLTGDTLCSSDAPYVLAGLSVPEPVVSLAVEPRGVDDRDKFEPSLEKLIWEDPTFLVREDKDTGQTILTGMGELHLEVILNRLEREFGVRTNSGTPQVVYRETIRGPVEHHEVFRREVEGRTQVGEITLRLEPLERNRGTEVVLPPADDSPLPGELLEVVRQSLEQAAASGARTGYPLTDIRIEADDIPYDANETSEIGLRAATQRGLAMAARDADVTLLEPVMTMEIVVPSEHAGKVLGSIQQKRGRIEGMATEADVEVIQALVPLAETFGYMTELRSSTQGRGTFTMEFSHFGQAPPETLERFGLK